MEQALAVRDVLTNDYVGVSEADTVLATVELMRAERTGCALVVRGSDPVGIVTEWDVLGLVEEGKSAAETTVGDAMSTPVITIGADRSLTEAAALMTRENVRNLAVTDDQEILGALTQRDVIAATGSFQGSPDSELAGEMTTAGDLEEGRLRANGGEYTTQGVCEACGSLVDALREANGQLLCADCRRV
ncbi:cyclic nucleotide-binding/CBS domain-containing protein [Saliphagus sp. LR7]|uniref:CBS domain-containing protein n=1 Tax=Saliphagus sp. LR7 TaxID=2282654 RepID=UPI000DF86450|nr:CBS domain-containing protein [Saliphagus sp. LR7]